ncbi:MAG: AI-2E family transporter [Patescibacteria group bacterium]|nr:AI-2E family transporter [Patescibacteria group bacterium]
MPEITNKKVDISMKSLIKIILVILALLFIFYVRDVIIIVFVSAVIATAINPWVDKFQKKGVPRILSIIIIYTIIFGLVSLAIALIIPAMTNQIAQFSQNFPAIYDKISNSLTSGGEQSQQLAETIQQGLQSTISALGNITNSIFAGLSGIFGGLFSLIGILVLTFYITLIEDGLNKFIQAVSPSHYQPYLMQLLSRIQVRLSKWVKGQLILSLIIGVASFIGLVILGIPYALVLGLIAGLTEFIPYAGPIIGAVPAVLIALTISPWKALFVIILYIIIQQLENNLLVPKIMQRTTGLNPIVIIIVMLLGARLMGILGVILAIPITIIGDEFIKDFYKEKKKKDESLEPDEIG